MELARFMPGRFNTILWNLPHFIMIGGSIWLGLWIIHYYYQVHEFKHHSVAVRVWSSIVWALTSVGLALVFEIGFLLFKKNFPGIKEMKYPIEEVNSDTTPITKKMGKFVKGSEVEYDCDTGEPLNQDTSGTAGVVETMATEGDIIGSVNLVHRNGRPAAGQIFAGLDGFNCPGVFMCGPEAMTHMVKKEARKANSYFGLTRYALYEEPFEM